MKYPITNLIAGLLAILLGFAIVFIPPVAALVPGIVGGISSVAGVFGVKNFRENYGIAKKWFESKTIWGALITVIPFVVFVIKPFFVSIELPEIVTYILYSIMAGGGGLTLYGLFDAAGKNTSMLTKVILILLLPLFFVRCSSGSSVVVQDKLPATEKYGIAETAEIVDALFLTYSKMQVDFKQVDVVALSISVVPQLIDAVKGAKNAVLEIKDLSDEEITLLTGIGNKYNTSAKIKQVFKVSLYLVQTYFVFYPGREEVTFYDYKGRVYYVELAKENIHVIQ
ncbi:MAG: hypothetical protein KKB34_10225 [Bacteroidetes bacterium]|nr:hypothetical protein [Bacteroidota bacterium]